MVKLCVNEFSVYINIIVTDFTSDIVIVIAIVYEITLAVIDIAILIKCGIYVELQ